MGGGSSHGKALGTNIFFSLSFNFFFLYMIICTIYVVLFFSRFPSFPLNFYIVICGEYTVLFFPLFPFLFTLFYCSFCIFICRVYFILFLSPFLLLFSCFICSFVAYTPSSILHFPCVTPLLVMVLWVQCRMVSLFVSFLRFLSAENESHTGGKVS